MKTILSYLDNMFMNLPHTEEVTRAKEELAAMMEDKYNELIGEGKKENEAVGIVISEFGNLQEVAAELGLEEIIKNQKEDVYVRSVTKEEAEKYIEDSKKFAKQTAIGTVICIYSPILLILLYNLHEYKNLVTEKIATSVGMSVLLVLIAIAVAVFIFGGMQMEKYKYLKTEVFSIDAYLDTHLKNMESETKFGTTRLIVIAITMCILGAIPLIVVGTLFENNGYLETNMLIVLILIVGIAVYILITAGSRQECFRVLRQVDDFSKEGKKSSKVIDKIAAPYWILATLIYLSWSMITMQWGFTWIVWPIAGILFGFIAAILSAVNKKGNSFPG
ncbi:MAG: permease prefix domain 1-containing protein [Velocimicrobium sp.]